MAPTLSTSVVSPPKNSQRRRTRASAVIQNVPPWQTTIFSAIIILPSLFNTLYVFLGTLVFVRYAAAEIRKQPLSRSVPFPSSTEQHSAEYYLFRMPLVAIWSHFLWQTRVKPLPNSFGLYLGPWQRRLASSP